MSDARSEAIRALAQEAADQFLAPVEEVLSTCRGTASVVNARMLAYALARRRFGWSYPEIGKAFGRDHSTVISGVRKAEKLWRDRLEWKAAAE